MNRTKKSISVRIDPLLEVTLRAWRSLGSLHNYVMLDYDDNDILEYCVHRVVSNDDVRGRFIIAPKDSERLNPSVAGSDYDSFFNNTTKNLNITATPKTFRISSETEEAIEILLKESPQDGRSGIVKSVLAVVLTSSKEFTRFLLRNSFVSRSISTLPSFISGKITPGDLAEFIISGIVPRNKNTQFENNMIKRFVDFVSGFSSLKSLQLEMLTAADPPAIEDIYSSALQEITKLKVEDYIPYSKNDLFFPILNYIRLSDYLIHLNEILHIYFILDKTSLKGIIEASIFPLILSRFYTVKNSNQVVSDFLRLSVELDKKYVDFRDILVSEAKSLLVLMT